MIEKELNEGFSTKSTAKREKSAMLMLQNIVFF